MPLQIPSSESAFRREIISILIFWFISGLLPLTIVDLN